MNRAMDLLRSGMLPASGLAVAVLAIVHLFAAELPFLAVEPRSRWLSVAGGVPLAFVFLQILPALARDEQALAGALGPGLSFVQNHVYLVALAGLLTFYAVERVVKFSRHRRQASGAGDSTGADAFWFSIGAFALQNAIIGYLLIRQERTVDKLALFAGAMALKFTVDDYGLHKDHHRAYDRLGRWLVVGALGAGWALGALAAVPPAGLAVLRAFLAGGVILNVLKEELPGANEGRFVAFAGGALAYAAILTML